MIGWLVGWLVGCLAVWLAVKSSKLEVETCSAWLGKPPSWRPKSYKIALKRPLGGVLGLPRGLLEGPWGILGGSWAHLGSKKASRAQKVGRWTPTRPPWTPQVGAQNLSKFDLQTRRSTNKILFVERRVFDFGSSWGSSWGQVGTKIGGNGVPRRCQKIIKNLESQGCRGGTQVNLVLAPKESFWDPLILEY